MRRGFKVKLYPTDEQAELLNQYLGACRYVYNYFLALKKETYQREGKNVSFAEMSRQLTKLRKETDWMREVPIAALQQSLRALDTAYNRFFRKQSKFPRFKKRGGINSLRKAVCWSFKGNKLEIFRGLSVNYRGRLPDMPVGTLTVSKDSAGNWWASAFESREVTDVNLAGTLGVDLGIITLASTSEGSLYPNARALNGTLERIKSASKHLSKKKEGSNRREKARLELAKLHRKVHFIRTNHLHHVSKAIVSKNHAVIALEDLSVVNMMKNRRLSRHIGDAGWGELVRQIEYKQEEKGGTIYKIGRFFPSSKTCSVCDFVVDSLPLSVRNWTCGKCGTEHDRDINAAKVIKKQATVLLGVEKKALASAKLSSVKRGGTS